MKKVSRLWELMPAEETTYFGYATLTALQKFQTSNGLTADGIFGPASRVVLVKIENLARTVLARWKIYVYIFFNVV